MSERLTKRKDHGCACWNGDQNLTTHGRYMKMLGVLAEYDELCFDESGNDGISLARLRELAEAERNGTNWIMPCKRGDTVYRIVGQKGKKRVGSRTVLSVTKYDTSVSVFTTVSGILGKTVFLTQAEAERALAATDAGKGENNA